MSVVYLDYSMFLTAFGLLLSASGLIYFPFASI